MINIHSMNFGGSKPPRPTISVHGKQSFRLPTGCNYPGSCPDPQISKKLAGRIDLPVFYMISPLRASRFRLGACYLWILFLLGFFGFLCLLRVGLFELLHQNKNSGKDGTVNHQVGGIDQYPHQ